MKLDLLVWKICIKHDAFFAQNQLFASGYCLDYGNFVVHPVCELMTYLSYAASHISDNAG